MSLITDSDREEFDREQTMERAEQMSSARKQAKFDILKKTFKQYYSLRIQLGIYDDLPEIKKYTEDVKKMKKEIKDAQQCGLFITINLNDKDWSDEPFDILKQYIDELKEILNNFDNATSWSFCLEQRSETDQCFYGFHFHIYIKGEHDETPFKYAEYLYRAKRCKDWVGDIQKIDVKKVKKGSKREENLQRYYMMGIKTKEKCKKAEIDSIMRKDLGEHLDDQEYSVCLYKSI